MTTYILKRPNGSFDVIQEPPDMEKWQFQKWKWKVTQDGSELINSLDPEFKKYNNLINNTMVKTSKITRVNKVNPWQGQNGTTFYCQVELENGDKIEIGKKKEQQVGWSITYEIIDTQQEYNKAKPVQPENGFSGGNRQGNNDNLKGVKIGHAITNAVSMYVALGGDGKNRIEAIEMYAKEIYELSEKLNNEL